MYIYTYIDIDIDIEKFHSKLIYVGLAQAHPKYMNPMTIAACTLSNSSVVVDKRRPRKHVLYQCVES